MADPLAPTPAIERRSLLMVLFAAFVLRAWRLDALGVWTDEASTWSAARGSLGELWRFCAVKDASPPLFHLATWLSLRFGDDEVHLRLVPLLASLGLVWLTYRLARLWTERREATLAAALVALSPFQLMYAQEARTYMLVGLWTVFALYLFARAVLLGRPRAWWPLTVVTALGLWTQSLSLLGVGVQALLVVTTASGRTRFVRWALALAAAVALYLPWVVLSMRQAGHLDQSHWYIDAPDPAGVFQVVRSIVLSPLPLVTAGQYAPAPGLDALLPRPVAHGLLLLIALGPLAFGAGAALGRGPRADAARFALVALIAPLLAVFVVSFRQSFWLPRYFVFLSPFVAMLTAAGLMRIRPTALARTAGAVVLLLSAYACMRVHWDRGKERWREVTASIAQRADARGAVVLVPFDSDPLRYYVHRLGLALPVVEVSHPAQPFHARWTAAQKAEMADTTHARTHEVEDVWIVVRSANSAERRAVVAMAESLATLDGRALVLRETWDSMDGPLKLARFRRGHAVPEAELRATP